MRRGLPGHTRGAWSGRALPRAPGAGPVCFMAGGDGEGGEMVRMGPQKALSVLPFAARMLPKGRCLYSPR